jgi:hypothetical protein
VAFASIAQSAGSTDASAKTARSLFARLIAGAYNRKPPSFA